MNIILRMQSPVPLSIAELQDHEEIFLSYARRPAGGYGSGIERDGQGPPTVMWQDPVHPITDPHAQRRGAWFIRKGDRAEDNSETFNRITKAQALRARFTDPKLIAELDSLIGDLAELAKDEEDAVCHEVVFQKRYPGWEIGGMQGSGDLMMNDWNVAYVNGAPDQPPELVHLRDEDIVARVYPCLVKWKARGTGARLVTIEEVRFLGNAHDPDTTLTPPRVEVWWGNRWLDRSADIEFAISNQRVLRDGEIVPALESCHQFGDIRHLLQTPNLNPEGPLYSGERPKPNGEFHPRKYFGSLRTAEVWLGEQQVIADRSRNLLRAALSGPVVLDWPVAGDGTAVELAEQERQVSGALFAARYRQVMGTSRLLRQGEWRFNYRRPSGQTRSTAEIASLEIHFRRNRYGWTMLGTSADGRRLLALACQGFPGEHRGHTLEEAAAVLRAAGAHDALLIDEGQDAFQIVGGIDRIPPRRRRRVKACFVFATRPLLDSAAGEENEPSS